MEDRTESLELTPINTAYLVETAARIVSLDEVSRRIRHVVSTGAIDRVNRIVDPDGWQLANFRKAPRVLKDHGNRIEDVIGRAINTKVEDGALLSTTEFDSEGAGAVAFRLVQVGLVNTWSVGWQSIRSHAFGSSDDCEVCKRAQKAGAEWGRHYTESELLEYSLVAIPANPDAVNQLHAAGLVRTADVDRWLEVSGGPSALVSEAPRVPERSAEFLAVLGSTARTFSRRAFAAQTRRRLGAKDVERSDSESGENSR